MTRPFDPTVIADGLFFPEGPVSLPGGDVLVCELPTGNLVRIAGDGSKSIAAHTGGGPNGLAMGYDGRIFVANNGGNLWRWEGQRPIPTGLAPPTYEGGSIQAVDLDSGEVEVIATSVDGHSLAGPNDLVFDAEGNLYFTDIGKRLGRERLLGGLCYLPRGAKEAVGIAWPLEMPNGVALSEDGMRIYVAETSTARVWYWDIERPGVLRPGHTPHRAAYGNLLCSVPGHCQLDSLAVDSEGHVCVATLLRGVITVIAPDGGIEATVHLPSFDTHVTNLCFGGSEMTTAYVTSAMLGKLYALAWPWPGFPLNFADGVASS
jgi:gluconolactonase